MNARSRLATCLLIVVAVAAGGGALAADGQATTTALPGPLHARTVLTAPASPTASPSTLPSATPSAVPPTVAAATPVPTPVPTPTPTPTPAASGQRATTGPATGSATTPATTPATSPAARATVGPAVSPAVTPTPHRVTRPTPHRVTRPRLPAHHRPPPRHRRHTPRTQPPTGPVLWNGDFEVGSVPHGATGRNCHIGAADGPDRRVDQYSSTQEMGNTTCTDRVTFSGEHTRTSHSRRALKITMGPHQQRELLVSKFSWRPDAKGTVDLWYGMSIYYDPVTWQQGAGYRKELSASSWDDPFGLRTKGPNGSLNLSSDLRQDGPHFALRRNTVRNEQHFYADGHGLDEIDLGRVEVGRWMDLVVHVRWSTTSRNALREAWRDGVYRGRRTTRNAVDALPHHLRVGQYQDTTIGHPRTSYLDNVRIGTSYAAVDPSR